MKEPWLAPKRLIILKDLCTRAYKLDIPADGRINDRATLESDTWYDVRLEWTGTEDISAHACRVYIDGRLQSKGLPLNNTSRNGICYVRFRSTAVDEDLAGWMVETIKADVHHE